MRRASAENRKAPRLQDVRAILRRSDSFAEVSMEQIGRVRMMHQQFTESSEFSFNYNTLLLVASILAGLGLISNSATTIIASMLVSPIMGPVVGMAYGATIKDWQLWRTAFKTEGLSLLFCIVIGAIIGCCSGPTALAKTWPTEEMLVRGNWQNFCVALPIAFFSGLGVAVGLLDDQTSSLVGVAISASLLPPAVNAGLLWVAFWFQHQDWLGVAPPLEPELLAVYGHIHAEFTDDLLDNYESEEDETYDRTDFRNGGIISLALTVANIILVMLSSMLMFRMKEVSRPTKLKRLLDRCMSHIRTHPCCYSDCPFERKCFGTILV
jgi:uncharacterized hydrophobic protein (TIGR00271 family)